MISDEMRFIAQIITFGPNAIQNWKDQLVVENDCLIGKLPDFADLGKY